MSALPSMASAPGPKGYPLMGVMPKLWRDPLGFLTETVRVYGDMVCLRRDRLYLLNHPDHVQQVLRDKRDSYSKNSISRSRGGDTPQRDGSEASSENSRRLILGHRSVALSEGEEWRRQRSLVQPAFSRTHLLGLSRAVTDSTTSMLTRWRTLADGGKPLEIEREMHALVLNILVKALFGNTLRRGPEIEEMVRALAELHDFFDSRVGAFISLPDSFPTPANRRFHQAHRFLSDFLDRTIAARRGKREDDTDILGLLCSAKDPRTGEDLSRAQLQDELVMLSILGHKTTAAALVWTFFLLSQSPVVDQRLHHEIVNALGDRSVTFEDLPKLSYLRQVLEESMRLYPPTWIIGRVALEDDVFGGYPVPAGATVLLSPYLLHRHPVFWNEPEVFNPDRFAVNRSAGGPRSAYLPFGDGERICIASHFAMTQMSLILAEVVAHYRLQAASCAPIQLQPRAVLRPRNGLKMVLQPRAEMVYANAV